MSPSRELWCSAHGSDLRQQAKELTDVLKDEIRRDKVFFFFLVCFQETTCMIVHRV